MTEHDHHWRLDDIERAEGAPVATVHMSCTGCSEQRTQITLRTDDQIRAEFEAQA